MCLVSEGENLDGVWLIEFRWKAETKDGNSPVDENHFVLLVIYLEYLGKRKP